MLLKALRTEAREGGGYACIAIPDSWLDGEIAEEGEASELLRAAIERDQDHGRISWVGRAGRWRPAPPIRPDRPPRGSAWSATWAARASGPARS